VQTTQTRQACNTKARRLYKIVLLSAALAAGPAGCERKLPSPSPAPPPALAPAAPAVVVPPQDRPEMAWWRKSMETRDQRLGWFREARFGMFIHWGAYSHVGGVWEGEPVEGYAEHLMRKKKIPTAVYRDKLVAPFNPTQFNADEWVKNLKNAGMGYLIITSKHHDGFAMYDSDVSEYNVVKASAWKHDPMKDLKAACKKHGVRFGFYYSQAWEWHHPDAPGNDWEFDNPGGDRRIGGQKWWEGKPDLVKRVRTYVDGKVIPQVKELIAKYDPDIMWFDTPSRLPPEENLRVLEAVRAAKPTLVVNSRICQPVPGGPPANFGDYFSTTDKPAEFPPPPDATGAWEAIPTTNESYGWHKMDRSHKPPAHFIQLLAKAAARGGNVLLNIGPMGNGKFEEKDVAILAAVGKWMKVNGASIQGTERTPLPVQAWGESTRKGNTLYLHVLSWPRKGRVVLGGLKTPVKQAYLLADARKKPLKVDKLGDLDLAVQGPAKAPDATDTVIALELEGEPEVDRTRLLSVDVASDTLRAFDGQISGGLEFGQGKARDAYVLGWKKAGDSVSWSVRLRQPATFKVAVQYDASKPSAGGAFVVKAGAETLEGKVEPTPEQPLSLGQVTLPEGTSTITVEGTRLVGEELFRLRALILTPTSDRPAGKSASLGAIPTNTAGNPAEQGSKSAH
jgi:alpha-L-fucosidase